MAATPAATAMEEILRVVEMATAKMKAASLLRARTMVAAKTKVIIPVLLISTTALKTKMMTMTMVSTCIRLWNASKRATPLSRRRLCLLRQIRTQVYIKQKQIHLIMHQKRLKNILKMTILCRTVLRLMMKRLLKIVKQNTSGTKKRAVFRMMKILKI